MKLDSKEFVVSAKPDADWSNFLKNGYVYLSGPLMTDIIGFPLDLRPSADGTGWLVSVRFMKPQDPTLLDSLEPSVGVTRFGAKEFIDSLILSYPRPKVEDQIKAALDGS